MVHKKTGPVTLEGMVAQAQGLATLPDVYLRIKQILDDPTASLVDVATALKTDPAMAARLMRVANSAFYGRPGGITTIDRAVSLLGSQQIHDLVLAAAVIQGFDRLFPDSLKPRDFWRASILAATIAKLLAEQCGFLDAERVFVAGLLAQVGQLVMLEQLPVQMGSIMHMAAHTAQRPCDLQRQALGFDYAEVGAALFSAWRLPIALTEPVRLHTQPQTASEFALESAIVHIAVEAANGEVQKTPREEVLKKLDAGAWQLTELSKEQFEQVRDQAQELASELSATLLERAA
jgi:HD-like signal output (HDOD) protein